MAVSRTQHHSVLAEGNRVSVLVGRDVLDGQRRHSKPLIDVPHRIEYKQFLRQWRLPDWRRWLWRTSEATWMTRRRTFSRRMTVTNEGSRSPFVIVADHAGNYLPRR